MPEVLFVPDRTKIRLFKSWNGEIGRSFGRLEKETVWRQKQLVAFKSGRLRDSITSKRKTYTDGLGFEAGSWTVEYAAANELGAKPHPITAKNAPALFFFWPKVGANVMFKSVNHPGNRPYRWAETGMERAMRMWLRGG